MNAFTESAMRSFRVLAATCLLAFAAPAMAQNCVGFTDVPSSSPFCEHVEWIKNRGITTGCTATAYCPDNPVTRLQMAAFLKRFGDALTPVDLPVASAGPTVVAPASNPVICATGDFTALNFPRRAYVTGTAILSAPTAAGIDVMATVVYSTNNGATWTAAGLSDQYATLYSPSTPAQVTTLAPFTALDMPVNGTMRFGLALSQIAGSGNVTAQCTTRVQVASRTGTSSPLDVQAAGFRGRGSN
jgi:hypothetical protein